MRKILLYVSLVTVSLLFNVSVASLLTSVSIPNVGTVKALVWLHVENGKIVNSAGERVILTGINHRALQEDPGEYRRVEFEDFQQIKDWGMNVVRVNWAWHWLEPTRGTYDPDFLSLINIVNWCSELGLYVVLDMHQYNWNWNWARAHGYDSGQGMPPWVAKYEFWTNSSIQEAWHLAWQEVAKRYANNPTVVGFDLLNEPNTDDTGLEWDQARWQRMLNECVAAIRQVAPNQIIWAEVAFWATAYDDPAGGSDMDDALPLNDNNVVYSVHPYCGQLFSDGIVGSKDEIRAWMKSTLNFKEIYNVPLDSGE